MSVDGAELPVSGLRRRALLVRLALQSGGVVGFRTLIEQLWPEDEPANPVPALHSLVARLRRALPVGVLCSEPAGYRLELPTEAMDVVRFEQLVAEGRRLLRGGDPESALQRSDQALRLWRGEPLAEFAEFPFAQMEATRLRELRLSASEDRIEAGLAGGAEPSTLVPELERLVALHPLRERLRSLLIRSLDADDRRPEALTAYENYRVLLSQELGADPGPDLRRLHLELLSVEPEPGVAPHDPDVRRRGNLRAPLTSFVGRELELARTRDRLRESRLVTLVGPGGVGKTRLATETAAAGDQETWLVELGSVTEPAEVWPAVAAAIGIPGTTNLPTRLAQTLASVPTLLVLDGCEHLLAAVAELAEDLLGRCPQLRVLATSREPLGITGEALQPVPPLDQESTVRLFTERARAARSSVARDPVLEQICRRLDGLPLAIELAAARLRSMPIPVLAERLEDRFRLLAGGSRTALPRHRTLRGVVAWSWDLLKPDERAAADRASVFVGGFTAEAAEHVGVAEDTLYALVDKSLLVEESGRFRMLDTIAEYGIERLIERGALQHTRSAHAACYLALAEAAEPWLRGADQLPWLAKLGKERENLLAAFRFALDSGDADTAIRLAAGLSMYWMLSGAHTESLRWIGAALRMPDAAPSEIRTRAVMGYLLNAMFAGELSDLDPSLLLPEAEPAEPTGALVRGLAALAGGDTEAGTQALRPWSDASDPWLRGLIWLVRAMLDGAEGRTAEGRRDLTEAVTAFRLSGERWCLSLTLMSLASDRANELDVGTVATDAIAMLDEAVALTRELGTHQQQVWLLLVRIDAGDREGARSDLLRLLNDPRSRRQQALARLPLADLARQDGDLAEARRQLELAGERGDLAYLTMYASTAGFLAAAEGRLDAAEQRLRQAVEMAASMPDMPMLAQVVVGMADVRWRRGDPAGAAELLGSAAAIRGGPNAGNPDVARLRGELAAYTERYAAASAQDPAAALAGIRGTEG